MSKHNLINGTRTAEEYNHILASFALWQVNGTRDGTMTDEEIIQEWGGDEYWRIEADFGDKVLAHSKDSRIEVYTVIYLNDFSKSYSAEKLEYEQ